MPHINKNHKNTLKMEPEGEGLITSGSSLGRGVGVRVGHVQCTSVSSALLSSVRTCWY